ncbi:hypothetical protein SAY87_029698 [Trapa incisa]|uniref:Uncharacterized protein n=1 Tax=Trapa incisa TaxID=236973 RepID=A0AAN7K854_9MYRT|nr:hypothetical protein SAY87_029698 [Trapa incisa]
MSAPSVVSREPSTEPSLPPTAHWATLSPATNSSLGNPLVGAFTSFHGRPENPDQISSDLLFVVLWILIFRMQPSLHPRIQKLLCLRFFSPSYYQYTIGELYAMARESYNEQVHAVGFEKFAYFMRLYIVCAKSFIENDNMVRAREVL